jgi:uncharacterized protein (DUF1330 family)
VPKSRGERAAHTLQAQYLKLENSGLTDAIGLELFVTRILKCHRSKENTMNRHITLGLSMVAGAAIGAAAVQSLHAQAKPPIYSISEIDLTNADAYLKEYAPRAQALIRENGGRILVAGGKTTVFDGDPPKTRVTMQVWDSIEKYQGYRNSAAYKELRMTGDKYAKFRTFIVEGVSN